MTISSYAQGGARVVRRATLVAALVLLVGSVAMQAFGSRYGEPASDVVVDVRATGGQLPVVVAEQEAKGLRCSAKPSLTDVVLFEDTATQQVTVMTFDRALRASAARSGWIRRYCI